MNNGINLRLLESYKKSKELSYLISQLVVRLIFHIIPGRSRVLDKSILGFDPHFCNHLQLDLRFHLDLCLILRPAAQLPRLAAVRAMWGKQHVLDNAREGSSPAGSIHRARAHFHFQNHVYDTRCWMCKAEAFFNSHSTINNWIGDSVGTSWNIL